MMKPQTWSLLAVLFIVLALGSAPVTHSTQAEGLPPVGSAAWAALGTGFTYQGRLANTGGEPVPGPCNFRFSLYQSAAGNDPVGSPQTKTNVTLDNGYFGVALDFGVDAFAGDARYLKIEVDCGSGAYTALDPRVELMPAPYALHAASTGALRGNPVSDNPPIVGNVLQWDGSFWRPAASGAGNAWSLTGNSGTIPGTHLVGTTDGASLTLAVSGTAALRLEPNIASPNIIGGYSGNSVNAGLYGVVIGGGGNSLKPNSVAGASANYATIGGGLDNTAYGAAAAVGGGMANTAGAFATVGGGIANTSNGAAATVGGGESNQVITGTHAAVGGGKRNTTSGDYATIGGGESNQAVVGTHVTIGGGQGNTAGDHFATIGGGAYNTASSPAATVSGGVSNTASVYAVVGGGVLNIASGWVAVIGGGQGNQAITGDHITIAGGENNTANAKHAAIGGGYNNTASSGYATIAGGAANTVGHYAATVSGGYGNTASSTYATVGGGQANKAITGTHTTIGGGLDNTASGSYAAVGGGRNNTATRSNDVIGGGYSNTIGGGYASTIGGGERNTADGEWATIGGGLGNTIVNGNATTIGGGYSNTILGYEGTISGGSGNIVSGGATIGGGDNNIASGLNSTVPGGSSAHASLPGQWAYANGPFSVPNRGNAQASLYVMRAETTSSGTWQNLYLDGCCSLLTIAPTRTLTFDALIVGRSSAGESAGYYCWGAVENVGGVTTFVGGGCFPLGEDDINWHVQAVADDVNDALAVQVMGNGQTIRWVATVRAAEVAW